MEKKGEKKAKVLESAATTRSNVLLLQMTCRFPIPPPSSAGGGKERDSRPVSGLFSTNHERLY